ncbi:hypothetical protein ZIOFF_046382 [Zingiber officinale]|uniref:Uncharacterized protein n=1 Tax=Zingiber officinale TaxID=94328 RepID=A0A8J5G046_ZINOF|nr:hypothetical protein ZIOFF_046382 [Zingiber officinale]
MGPNGRHQSAQQFMSSREIWSRAGGDQRDGGGRGRQLSSGRCFDEQSLIIELSPSQSEFSIYSADDGV